MFSQPDLLPIARLIAEPGVTDLVINGHNHAAVLQNSGWRSVPSGFASEAELAKAARELVALAGGRIDLAHPFASVNLEKIRAHALLASAVNDKTHISIRVHASREVALSQWLAVNKIAAGQELQLRQIVNGSESFLVSGSAGAGKTTLLRAMLGECSAQRIITIEDTAELQLNSASCVALVVREANVEGRGEISLNQLLIEALRMRPDRIVVGEVRSSELITLLQASSSGHSSAATIHATSSNQVLNRIESIAIGSARAPEQIVRLAKSSIRWFVHITNSAGLRGLEILHNE